MPRSSYLSAQRRGGPFRRSPGATVIRPGDLAGKGEPLVRFIKMLGLGMLACLATMAFVGATSASADSFCTQSGHHTNECPAANRYSGNLVGKSTTKALLLEN